MSEKTTYSVPVYYNGIKTDYTVSGIIGDDRYQELTKNTPNNILPEKIDMTISINNLKEDDDR